MSGWHMYQHLLYKRIQLLIIIIIINGGILSLTDSHHHHHGQNPTMVGICNGGNVLGNHINDGDDDDSDDNVAIARIAFLPTDSLLGLF